MVQLLDMLHVVSLDAITRIVHGKFNCITVNFEKTQYNDKDFIIYCHDVTINTGYTYKHYLIWNQRRQDSNPGPPGYEAAALPTEPLLLDN